MARPPEGKGEILLAVGSDEVLAQDVMRARGQRDAVSQRRQQVADVSHVCPRVSGCLGPFLEWTASVLPVRTKGRVVNAARRVQAAALIREEAWRPVGTARARQVVVAGDDEAEPDQFAHPGTDINEIREHDLVRAHRLHLEAEGPELVNEVAQRHVVLRRPASRR